MLKLIFLYEIKSLYYHCMLGRSQHYIIRVCGKQRLLQIQHETELLRHT